MNRRVTILICLFVAVPPVARAAPQTESLPEPLSVAAEQFDGNTVYVEPPTVDGDAWAVEQDFEIPPYADAPVYRHTAEMCQPWQIVLLPDGLLYRSYLAGVHEPRFGSVWQHTSGQGDRWDIALGGRVGILRYGDTGAQSPSGYQVDVEGAAFPRLDLNDNNDLMSTDFRFGVPLTYAVGAYQAKLAYYHLSSHLGDELIERDPTIIRDNYSRDAIVLGQGLFVCRDLRLYGEIGYAFYTSGRSEPWEAQFGAEFTPLRPGSLAGAPFAAVNAHLLEDVDWGGNFVAQLGWLWRGAANGHLFRVGFQYFNGHSNQFQFLTQTEVQYGLGLWYDY